MSLHALGLAIKSLPPDLQEQVEGYARFVRDESEAIFNEVGVQPTPTLVDQLVLLAGIKRLWTLVDAQFGLLNDSLVLLAQHQVSEIRIHSAVYSRGSKAYQHLSRLQSGLDSLMRALGIQFVKRSTISDLVRYLAGETDGTRRPTNPG